MAVNPEFPSTALTDMGSFRMTKNRSVTAGMKAAARYRILVNAEVERLCFLGIGVASRLPKKIWR